jgi:hypothetical protein
MLLSMLDYFSDAQAITVDAASEKYLDTLALGDALAKPLWLVVQVHTTFDSAGEAGTLAISLRTAAAAADGALTTPTTLFTTAAIAEASLVAGYQILKILLPPGLLRYIDLNYDVNDDDPFTAGKLDAFLTPCPDGMNS